MEENFNYMMPLEAYNSKRLFQQALEFDKLKKRWWSVKMLYEDFGRRVRQQRIALQMTQEKLSERAGISLSFLGHIERGTRKASLDTVVKLCNALQVSPSILLQDSLDSDLLGDRDQSLSDDQRKLLREISNRIIEYNELK